jgi:biopolymer transport protein TolQ
MANLIFILISDPFTGNIFRMVAQSTFFAKVILLILLFFSIVSWGIIINKIRLFKKVDSDTRKFLSTFRKRKKISDVYLSCLNHKSSPLTKVLAEGYKELEDILKTEKIPSTGSGSLRNPKTLEQALTVDEERVDSVRMALERAGSEELERLGKNVVFLATTGNISPFFGLLGTIWGVMDSFASIGVRGSASLAVVAPGIAEALIATIVGLAVAIPAVIGYNHINNKLKTIAVVVDNFSLEFLSAVKKEIWYEKKGLSRPL